MEPEDVTFQVLKEITNDFSEERILGAGSFGVVYRGVTKNGDDVAVKMLHDVNPDLDDKQFQNEFNNLTMLKHQNIVQVLGYCYENEKIPIKYSGRTVLAEKIYRVLCFEYLDNGSLQNHLSDEFHGVDWNTRYKIIKGTCEGLKYIHEELEEPLYHLDLKPDNILLDKDMVAKIADFGLSRIFGKELTRTTRSPIGTIGYQPPEFIESGEISKKFDIFSLGVVMTKIVSGAEGYSECASMNNDEFIDLVLKNWRNRFQATWSGSSLEAYCHQVETCTQIAFKCMEKDSQKRLDISKIIDKLNEVETDICKSMLLHVKPLQLCFPLEPTNSMTSCSVELTNNTDYHVAFRLLTENQEYLEPLCGIVPSRHSYTLSLSRPNKLLNPPASRDKNFTLESSVASHHQIQHAVSDAADRYNHFFMEAKENGREVQQVKLTVVYEQPVAGKSTAKLLQKRCHENVSGMTMLNNTMEMRKKPKEITDQHQHVNLMTRTRCNEMEVVDIRDTYLDVGELIIGRAEEKKKVMASMLQSTNQKIVIFPIYGIGGIGKTTFAKLIYNDANFKYYYKVWVSVSLRFDLNKIGNSIISQLSGKESLTNERQMVHNCLTKLVSGKKILVVLDDLWEDNPFHLEDMKAMLYLGDSINTIVLVTTRSELIAEKICTNHKPYKIESLTNDMCWDIIRQRSGFEARDDKECLAVIGREIALKCGGVALAAQSLGFLLQSMKSDQWIKVKESDIWNKSISEDASLPNHVLASLKLSYESMAPCLKACFSHCAIFPKGHKIFKNDLIYQWISMGFIKPTKLLSTMQLCEKYIVHLLGLSFLQCSMSPKTVGAYDRGVTLFTMHDLVHDLSRLVMADKIMDASKQGTTGGSSCQYALLTDCSKPLGSFISSPKTIRAMRYLDCGQIELQGNAFASAKSLRVMDLSECQIQNLPDAIGELVQLRYLNARKIQSQIIPDCITKLSKLIYLNLSGSRIPALPELISELKGLMHLDMSHCTWIEKLPESFVNLKRLLHLDLSNCHWLRGVSNVLVGLTNVQYLDLSFVADVKGLQEVIGNLIEFRHLDLSWTLNSICQKPGSDKVLSFIDRICTLSNLEHLDLSATYSIVHVPESIGRLRKLHTLNLSLCRELMRLPECVVKMDCLKIINLTGCSNLDKSTLSRSEICIFSFPHFVVDAVDGESSSNIHLLRHAYPNELYISCLHNVKSVEEVRSIKFMEKQGIYDLKLEWIIDAPRSVEDVEVLRELVPPSTLQKFNMKGYDSVSLPAWVNDITLYLPALKEIEFWGLCKCNSLPPLGQLRNLKELSLIEMDSITRIEEGFCGGVTAFPQLKKFNLCRMKKLEVWNTLYSYGEDGVKEYMFPILEELSITDCPMLRLKPCPHRAKEWFIENSDNVLSWGDTLRSSASASAVLKDVIIRVKSSKVTFDQWRLLPECVVKMDSLKILNVDGCSNQEKSMLTPCKIIFSLPHCFVVCADDGESSRNIFLLRHAYPKELHISSLDNVKVAEEVQSIKLIEKQGIEYLELQWTRDTLRSVEDVEVLGELVPPRTLREFNIKGYNSVSFPAWVMDITLYLPELEKIEFWDLCKCNSLPALGQLHNLQELHMIEMDSITRIEVDFCGGARAFPQLKKFHLCRMKNLELWKTMYSCGEDGVQEFMFPNLAELLICDCPKLRLEPCPPRTKVWEIENNDNVLSSWRVGPETNVSCYFAAPIDLIVRVISSKVPLDQWRLLHHLPAMSELSIICCTDLTCSSPEIIRCLSFIKSLHLEDNAQPNLPNWLADIICLQELVIENWTQLRNLPGSMQHLNSLQLLALKKCLRLTTLPIWLGNLASLKRLDIRYCGGIKSLPQSILKPTNLEELKIFKSVRLQNWCELKKNKMKLAHISKDFK